LWAAVVDDICGLESVALLLSTAFSMPRLSQSALTGRCLSADPSDRPTFAEIMATFRPPIAHSQPLFQAGPLPPVFIHRSTFCDLAIEIPGGRAVDCHRSIVERLVSSFVFGESS
jgi:hypothetical protein